jgi:hypothetical protein
MNHPATPPAWQRLPLLLPAMLALAAGVWGGLARVGAPVMLPVDHAGWLTHHGALMVSGFLGTLIGVERAVGSGARAAYGAPILSGIGAVLAILGQDTRLINGCFVVASLWFAAVTIHIAWRHRAFFTALMAGAALAWVVGNLLLLLGRPVAEVAWWWAAFLGWTIVAERLELSRLLRLPRFAHPLLVGALGLQLTGLLVLGVHPVAGERLIGVAWLAQALWLLRHDLARLNLRLTGLPKFTAVCLVIGYGWLALAGALLAACTPLQTGASYDAVLHAFFLGFIFAMIFGHAPIIFPAVLRLGMTFSPRQYAHVWLLLGTLCVRVGADLAGWVEVRSWAAAGNAGALALFLGNTLAAAWSGRTDSPGALTGIKQGSPPAADESNVVKHDPDQIRPGNAALWCPCERQPLCETI